MGWSFSCINVGKKAHVAELTSQAHFGAALTPLEHRVVGNHLWQLVRVEATGRLTIFLDLLAKEKGGGWGNKGLSEQSGPYHYDCPLSLLDKASPTDSEYALAWRKKVRAHHAARLAKPKPAAGLVVQYNSDTYRLISSAGPRRGWTCEHIPSGMRYRIKATQLARSTEVEATA
jgi:hypothetical protein